MPITIEPTKPRMCHDERFLNLWITLFVCIILQIYPDAFSMDTFRLLLMGKVDLIISAYTRHALRFSVSGWLAGILYTPRYLLAGRRIYLP